VWRILKFLIFFDMKLMRNGSARSGIFLALENDTNFTVEGGSEKMARFSYTLC